MRQGKVSFSFLNLRLVCRPCGSPQDVYVHTYRAETHGMQAYVMVSDPNVNR